MDIILEKAFNSLSITCNKIALHPNDEDHIKLILHVINNNNIPLIPDEIEQWLLSNDWQEKPVKKIVKWCQSISEGKRVQLKNKSLLPSEKEIWTKLNT